MAGCGFNQASQRGGVSAESLRAEAEGIYAGEQVGFQGGVELVAVFFVDISQEGF